MKHKNIILIGGSGFVGKHLAIELVQRGYHVTLPCRRPQKLNELKVLSNLNICQADIMDQNELNVLCQGKDVVVNLLGILNETKKESFRHMHVDFVKSVVQACQANKIKRLLHMSALGANQASGRSQYLRTKGEGENLIHSFGQHNLQVTSFQPSVIFGEDDSFINRFASLLKLFPVVFPLACPDSRFSPVYIRDVVSSIADSIDDSSTFSKRYPLCGSETWTLRQIVELIRDAKSSKCKIIGLSDKLSRFQALMLQNLPGNLFTLDNYRSLQTPCVCEDNVTACSTGISSFLNGLTYQYSRRPYYDDYRQQLKR